MAGLGSTPSLVRFGCQVYLVAYALRLMSWQEGLTVSSISCDHWWHLNVIRGSSCDQVKNDIARLKTIHRLDR